MDVLNKNKQNFSGMLQVLPNLFFQVLLVMILIATSSKPVAPKPDESAHTHTRTHARTHDTEKKDTRKELQNKEKKADLFDKKRRVRMLPASCWFCQINPPLPLPFFSFAFISLFSCLLLCCCCCCCCVGGWVFWCVRAECQVVRKSYFLLILIVKQSAVENVYNRI